MSVLEQARTHLTDLALAADRDSLPTSSLLSSLQSVGDMVCRIGGNEASFGPSRHYTADKSGDLVIAALRVQREAFVLYAAAEAGVDEAAADVENVIFELSDLLETVTSALTRQMWGCSKALPVYRSDADAVGKAARQLAARADLLASQAVPDDEGDW